MTSQQADQLLGQTAYETYRMQTGGRSLVTVTIWCPGRDSGMSSRPPGWLQRELSRFWFVNADGTPLAQLLVAPSHRAECTFGTGFFRITLSDGGVRYCQSTEEVEHVHALLGPHQVVRTERDGYCLDGLRVGDANTPDVVDAEMWLALPRADAMTLVGLKDEHDYARVYHQVEAAVYARDNRQSQTGVHVPIVIKKRGRALTDVNLTSSG